MTSRVAGSGPARPVRVEPLVFGPTPLVRDAVSTESQGSDPAEEPMGTEPLVDYRTDPTRYRHWTMAFDGPIATLALDVAEDGGIRDGYKLKLNSYDLGVDIELYDAVQRIRFEHPEVRTVVVTSARDRIFCSGANIFMLGLSSHAWKVNFCKFTNETRNGLEDSSRHSGLKFLAAVNGACAGGGYELALACDEIYLIDDRSSTVSLPEVPLLGVLPGTGGLTRVTDKRHVRHDLADIFCTVSEGVRGQRAKDWRLVDEIVKPAQFADAVRARALALAARSDRPADAQGVALPPLARTDDDAGHHYEYVDVTLDRAARAATITLRAPGGAQPADIAGIEAAGARWWPLQARARTRRRDPDVAHQCARHRHVAHQDAWRSAGGACRRRDARRTRAALAGARDGRLPAADVRAAGRVVALALRAGGARVLLRRHAARARARRRSHLHAAPARRRRRPNRSSRSPRSTSAPIRW